jgi:lipopolysaccharide transport system permease protein
LNEPATTATATASDDADIFGHEHVTVIEPPRGWRMLDWRELWAYRELLWVLAARDVQVRYKQAVLGAAWAVIRPFTTMVIFSVVFGRLAGMPSEGFPYPVFVYAGLLPWTFFASAVTSSGQSLVGSAHLVSKVYFPRLIIPLASAGSALVDLLFSAVILLAMMAWWGVGWTPSLFVAPLLLPILVFAALGVGTLLAALTVSYRDFTHITPFLVQVWMFVTPVIYPVSLVDEGWRWLLYLNPMTGVVEGFRSTFLGKPFDTVGLAASLTVSLALFIFGVAYFEKVERRFADVI